MSNGYMLTLVGEDQPGIVARVTATLFELGVALGETSMIRLGGSFTIMMMIKSPVSAEDIDRALAPTVDSLDLCMHLDPVDSDRHEHIEPNVSVHVHGADRAGIVSAVTAALLENGFNILDLTSDVIDTDGEPVYLMRIEGYSDQDIEVLRKALNNADIAGLDVSVNTVETLVG